MTAFLDTAWAYLLGTIAAAIAVALTVRVVLDKRSEQAAVAWVGIIWLNPVVGAITYLLFGVNRIRRRATRLEVERAAGYRKAIGPAPSDETAPLALPDQGSHLISLISVIDKVAETPLVPGNHVTPLINGDEAYPAMVAAIDSAERSVAISSYIFNNDAAGRLFVDALHRAVGRGVSVRVLIDGVGSWYSYPPIMPLLRQRGITAARFLYSLVPWQMPYLNLRNHHKLLIIDGRSGFTGGMNIQKSYLLREAQSAAFQDVHFRAEGPVVRHMMETFAGDWSFTTGEDLHGESWFPDIARAGSVAARGISAGPHQDSNNLRWALLAALSEARQSIKIVTPYFLPDEALATALCLAAMGGVAIDIVMPARNNLPFITWAAMPKCHELLLAGCRIWLSPPPFDHAKLFLVDEVWSLLGSTNWDPRSLRLNFEFDLECYDTALAGSLNALFEERVRRSRPLSLADINARSLPIKLRDGVARLFSAYL